MLNIDGVEANNGSVEANVCFSDVGTEIVGSSVFGKVSFGAVEGDEKGVDSFFISFLCSRNGELVAESLEVTGMERAKRKRAYVAKPDL